MVVAIGVAAYVGLAVVIGRFLSLTSRWERAIGSLMEADFTRLAAAGDGREKSKVTAIGGDARERIRVVSPAEEPVEVGA